MQCKKEPANYSCDLCKRRHARKGCERCIQTDNKRPSRFRLDKNQTIVCPARVNDQNECALVSNIRIWNEELKRVEVEIESIKCANMQPIVELSMRVANSLCRRYPYSTLTEYENRIAIEAVSKTLHSVSYTEIVKALTAVRDSEDKLISLRRRVSELQEKIKQAKQQLGI